ncbi:MAG: protein-export chaperone SecB [Candidatus Eremiobacteraeota bacterium]|nr:protein-export chaperone SecB [Candidatus Eremiobacteraeota bacterium]
MLSMMQLDDYRLLHLLIDANENYSSDVTRQVKFETDFDFEVYKSTDGQTFKISLSIRIKPVRNRKHCSYKKIEIKLEGIFSFPPGTEDKIIEKLVPFNCLAILHGLARGIVSSVTGNTQGGKFLLPIMNFVEKINEKAKKQDD